jgi:hypothetical protein
VMKAAAEAWKVGRLAYQMAGSVQVTP